MYKNKLKSLNYLMKV